MDLVGEADWHRCRKLQLKLFDHSTCPFASCSWGGAYQPELPAVFYGFSYLYDRSAAIGLFDGQPQQYGSVPASRADIDRKGAELCALSSGEVTARFSSHQDSSKAGNFCGDVAYLSALLESFGFPETTKLTMTNKINVRARARACAT